MAPVAPNQRSLFSGEFLRRDLTEVHHSEEKNCGADGACRNPVVDRPSPPVQTVRSINASLKNGLLSPSLWSPDLPVVPITPAPSTRVVRSIDQHGSAKFPQLPNDRYDIIYADPPWDYKGQLQHAGPGSKDTGGAIRHYPTVTSADLRGLDIPRIAADDCLLFMWATSPHLDQAIDLGKSWDFAWATVAFVWDKVRVNPGFYTLSQCELCLVFKRGRIPRPRGARNVRQLISIKRGSHSTKPAEIRRCIEEMFPEQKKIELFARYMTEGWRAWGLNVSNGA